MKLKRLGRGRYVTPDGMFYIERDSASLDEYDEPSDPEWFVYSKQSVDRGGYGPPEALTEAATLRACRAWVEDKQRDDPRLNT